MIPKPPYLLLLIDDEANIRRSLVRHLHDLPITIHEAASGEEGLQRLTQHQFAVIIADQRLPGISGADVLAQAAEMQPEAIRIVLTGHGSFQTAVDAMNRVEAFRFLTKPWSKALLRETVTEGLRAYLAKTAPSGPHRASEEDETETPMLSDTTVESLLKIMKLHSPQLHAHSNRVAQISGEITLTAGHPKGSRCQIQQAALLHDLGKIEIPNHLLERSLSELNEREARLLESHPVLGARILGEFEDCDELVGVVRHHHERFEGGGVPDGISGEHIPEGARIIAVADFIDHLSVPETFSPTEREAFLQDSLRQASGHALDLSIGGDEEIRVQREELIPGQVLSRDIVSIQEQTVLPVGTVLTEDHLEKLEQFSEWDPGLESIFVTRQSKQGNARRAPIAATPRPARPPAESEGGSPIKKTILLIDDDRMVLRTLRRQLERAGYRVFLTVHPEEVMTELRRGSASALITDFNMPGINGDELIRKVQAEFPRFPCIVLTAYASRKNILKLAGSGKITRIFTKPWSRDELLHTLSTLS
ncbi:MAG: response regulator [Planctomycetota bacterium]|jgi:response regulator RpfG family c-di-GMP phosphodiesterase